MIDLKKNTGRWTRLGSAIWFVGIAVFLFVNISVRHTGSANAFSRYALSLGMVANHSFTIDGFEFMTGDWSQTPDGHYYSNKPPGPTFFGLPIAWLVDKAAVDLASTKEMQLKQRVDVRVFSLSLQAIFLQVIPCIFLVIFQDKKLKSWGISEQGRVFALLGYLFGITPAMLQNTMFGHAMAGNAILGAVLCALDKKLIWSGFLFGVSLLADYGAAFVLPGLIYVWYMDEKPLVDKMKLVLLGALSPAVIWIWYHWVSFGSPFVTSHKFLAPEWVDTTSKHNALWGIFSSIPDFEVALKLLVGIDRGLLFTQPWVLFSLVLGIVFYTKNLFADKKKQHSPNSAIFNQFSMITITGMLGLLVANSSFNGWHGGLTIGPRYLSIGLALFPTFTAILWDQSSILVKRILYAGLVVAVFYYCLAFPQDILTWTNPWGQLFDAYFSRNLGMKIKVTVPAVVVGCCFYHYYKNFFKGSFRSS